MCESNKKTPAKITVSIIANTAAAEYAILARRFIAAFRSGATYTRRHGVVSLLGSKMDDHFDYLGGFYSGFFE
jgi:hypothetical protein